MVTRIYYEEGDRIVVEPVPSLEALGGVHASDDRDRGEMIDTVRELKSEEIARDEERIDRLRSSGSGDE